MLRVDHAGELGAKRIYEGQLEILRRGRATGAIARMAEREEIHLREFERLLTQNRVRPSLLTPLWSMAGYGLGVLTALMGERAAMAATVAVEEVIERHYETQAERLGEEDPALKDKLLAFREDEIAHLEVGLQGGAAELPLFGLFSAAIKAGSRLAIAIAERL
jgi:3-demethoxyubiquinol 3-hydroxylase